MTYIVNWTKTGNPPDGKPAIILPLLAVDIASTSLTLTGKGTPNYGEIQQENFIRLLENFTNDTPPANPTIGQLWNNSGDSSLYIYNNNLTWQRVGGIFKGVEAPTNIYEGDLWWDTANNKLFVFDGSIWGQIWPSLSVIPVVYVDEFNSLVDRYNKIAASPEQHLIPTDTCSSTSIVNGHLVTVRVPFDSSIPGKAYGTWYGYGQKPMSHVTTETLTNTKWVELFGKFAALADHQGTNRDSLANRGFILDRTTTQGIVTALEEYQSSLPVIDAIELNRFNVSPFSLENALLTNSNYTRSNSYFVAKTHDLLFTFTDLDSAVAFFIAGGKLKTSTLFTPSQSTVFTNSWQAFIVSIGSVSLSVTGTTYVGAPTTTPGFFDLAVGGAYTTIFKAVSTFVGSVGAYYEIRARLEIVPNSAQVVVRLNIIFAPDGILDSAQNGSYSSSNSAAIGTTVSSVTVSKANTVFLNNLELPYPTVTQTGTFITDSGI